MGKNESKSNPSLLRLSDGKAHKELLINARQWHKYIKSNQLFINADMTMDMEYGLCECIQEVIQNDQRLQQIQSTLLTGGGGCITSKKSIFNVIPYCTIYKNEGKCSHEQKQHCKALILILYELVSEARVTITF